MNAEDRGKSCLALLASAQPFAGLPPDALRRVAGGCSRQVASRGQVLCTKGQALSGFYVVVSGRVKLSILSEEGGERVLDILLPGRTFAEASAFLGRPCPVQAVSLTESCLLFVGIGRLREAMQHWPEVASGLLDLLARRTCGLIADLERCCLQSAAQRVAGRLLRDAVQDPAQPDQAHLTLPAAKSVVASSLNLSAETFSRELRGLSRHGLIRLQRRDIDIPSVTRLRGFAGNGTVQDAHL
ncbi:Crp/Fnr family transcriptional regulator [Thiohalocapsa marina]|uniref:Crp/Fnr family transcriptional regulator n=1 Tax=Thiohalocapsa marina TaxID=424902 RepID=A0A5M8FSA4_9GAMM|nr:Crp/Fnr family transcriptional regulator [Thiohalocapsa marina]KAA6186305.1 Crp/Fnr family transcriptional regulator [Thiohalocapsa marina]